MCLTCLPNVQIQEFYLFSPKIFGSGIIGRMSQIRIDEVMFPIKIAFSI